MAGITGASTCADHDGRESGSARGARATGPARRRVGPVEPAPVPTDSGPVGDPAPPAPGAPADGAVFVDVSGRRRAWLRRMGWMVAASCVCFGATLAAVVSGADSAAPRLALPGGVRAHEKAGTGAATPGEGPGRGAVRSPSLSPEGGIGAPPRPSQVDSADGAVRADGSSAPAPAGTAARTQPRPGPSGSTAAPSPSRRSTATPPGPSPTPPAGEATGSPSASAGDDPAGTGEPSASAPGGEPTEGTASPGALLERVSLLLASG
ncbi:hypothetical protein [Streptomyces sp. Tue6028]|uniref:hypothetical protein n=1 Tax=Streptomyces sp. Tue6028 TaxID=2036037 RepID=UPI00117FD009|nr:hypothetical protein [Streptomyces sp. Tue6028]